MLAQTGVRVFRFATASTRDNCALSGRGGAVCCPKTDALRWQVNSASDVDRGAVRKVPAAHVHVEMPA